MRELCVFCVLLVLCSGLAGTASASVTLSIDIQESPVPDLSQIRNVYHGGAPCVYAFLVVTAGGSARTDMGIAAYELGYRLVCPDASVVNQGFHRLEGWQRLGDEAELPLGESVAGSGLPAVIGYWELELKRGRKSRAEFQILPNTLSDPASINLVNGEGDLIQLSWKALSEDRHCFGLINRTFYLNRPYVWTMEVPRDGQIVAGFMPGVIEMPGRMGTTTNIVDPALREVTERFGLISIKSLCGLSGSSDRQLRSRTGEALTLSERCDTYGLGFPVGVDLPALLDSIRALPRCEFAEPSPYGEPTICTSPEHVPNDELASESWYLERTGVECAWDWEIGNDGVRVGLIDMGVDFLL